jgi:hypothetical protein
MVGKVDDKVAWAMRSEWYCSQRRDIYTGTRFREHIVEHGTVATNASNRRIGKPLSLPGVASTPAVTMSSSFPNEKFSPLSSSIIPLHDGGRPSARSPNPRQSKSIFHKLSSALLIALAWLSLYRITTTYLADNSPASYKKGPFALPTLDAIDIQSLALGEITWHACPEYVDTSGLFDCGHLAAPLDHLDESTPLDERRKAAIYIIRYKARQSHGGELSPREHVQGTIIMNPGGPGGSGVDFLTKRNPKQGNVTRAELFDRMMHGKYDMLSFDPRGVGLTWPRANCWKDAADSCLNSESCSS